MRVNNKQRAGGHSIKIRIASALFALVALQGLVLLCFIGITGTIRKNDIAAYNILSNQSNSRGGEVEDIFNTKRKNIVNASLELTNKIEQKLTDHHIGIDKLASNDAAFSDILGLSLDELIVFTKYSGVTGVFVVLDPAPDIENEARTSRTGIYLRDSSPGVISANNSNLLLEYGYVDIARSRGIAVDYLWTRDMSFSDGYDRDFYFKPVRAVLDDPDKNKKLETYGYWSPSFKLRKDDTPVITYSLPLMLSDGTVYGVIGFELQTNHVGNLMNAAEIPYNQGFYLLCTDMSGGIYNDSVVFSGVYANQFLSGPRAELNSKFVYEDDKSLVYEMSNPNFPGRKAIGAYSVIELYETYSPFYNEKCVLICMAPKDSVMSGSRAVKNAITISIVSTIVLALVLSVFITFYISGPIHRLSEKVKSIDPEKPVRFEKTGILEIDELSGAFEVLSDGVSAAAAKMFKIVEFVDMPLGSFEIDTVGNTVRLSESLFGLLDLKAPDDGSFMIPLTVWARVIQSLEQDYFIKGEDGIVETLYMTGSSWAKKRWFRVRQITENMRDIGILIDITDEIMQKQRLQFERNYDPLTKLFSRQAFMNKAYELMKSHSDKAGIMMFADLDDLKFVNDMYGHDTGDDYIKQFASFLSRFNELGAVSGRISGDEFVMFMSGFSSRDEARAAFDNVIYGLKDQAVTASNGVPHKLRVSIGVSYYPSDSEDISELVKYADYAMYEIKHSIKGEIKEFNIRDYNKNSFVIEMKDMLNLLIEEKRICFAFQPIIDVKTGEIFAYEALMRSMVREFKSPVDILRIARSQSKLYQIEKLTFYTIFDWLSKNINEINGKKIFVNSIPGQIFSENDMNEMYNSFNYLSGHIVFEITENEFSSQEDTKKKVGTFREFGSMIAIDDYGSGYSNELALLSIEPDFLKIDQSIVRDIDKDTGKQQLVQNAIAYASRRNIKVIAEGVETYEEMNKVIDFGVDYIQGYYTAKPSFEISDIPKDLKERLIESSRGRH